MKIAITGATGFVGSHLARRLAAEGHQIVVVSRRMGIDVADGEALAAAFAGCQAVAHCAGINREVGSQTYARVHVEGTRAVVEAARRSGVRRIALMSFLRARPDCGSAYHESKWAAEEIVRSSGLSFTIVKAAMTYGRGDHMLDHLSRTLHTLPLIASVGFRDAPIRPLAIDDLVDVLRATLADSRLTDQTVAVTGAEELYLREAVRRIAGVLGKRVWVIPGPVWAHYVFAQVLEWTMKVPLVAKAQVRILSEGVVAAAPPCDSLPADLMPRRRFTEDQIRAGLPEPSRFGLQDLRCCAALTSRGWGSSGGA
jgi:NADH dehydrogenase